MFGCNNKLRISEELLGTLRGYAVLRHVDSEKLANGIIAKFLSDAAYSGKDVIGEVVAFGELYATATAKGRRLLSKITPRPEDSYMNAEEV